jgi:hypothetical protein
MGTPLKKLLIGGLGLVACGTNALALGGGSSTPSGDIADVTATPFGGVGVGIALPNTGAAVPFVLGFSLVAVGLVLLAASVWLMSRRREDS